MKKLDKDIIASIESELVTIPGIETRKGVPLSRLTSLGVGGRASLMVLPSTTDGLCRCLSVLERYGVSPRVLGRGTNLLVGENDQGLVLSLERFRKIIPLGKKGRRQLVKVGAGCSLRRLLAWCHHRGLSGLEPLAGIPGSVGGATFMNAGVQGHSMAHLIEEVELAHGDGLRSLNRADIPFGYRSSGLNGWIICSVTLGMNGAPGKEISKRVAGVMEKRRRSQPLGARSAGCIFKNPPGDAAGRLIEAAGLKGMRRGGAVVSTKHANFIVNDGTATAQDVMELMETIRREVARKSGLWLQPEVTIWS